MPGLWSGSYSLACRAHRRSKLLTTAMRALLLVACLLVAAVALAEATFYKPYVVHKSYHVAPSYPRYYSSSSSYPRYYSSGSSYPRYYSSGWNGGWNGGWSGSPNYVVKRVYGGYHGW